MITVNGVFQNACRELRHTISSRLLLNNKDQLRIADILKMRLVKQQDKMSSVVLVGIQSGKKTSELKSPLPSGYLRVKKRLKSKTWIGALKEN